MHHDAVHAIKVLSENGRHFLRSTLDEIGRDDETGNRNAVIFVAAAVEVLLKTRLALEHWTLLFEDPSKAKLQDLKSGEFLSVQASKLVQRLNNVAPLSLKSDSPDQVFRLRNRMVHYGPPPQLAVRVELAVGLGFALDFIHKHLLSELPTEEQTELETLKQEITEVFSKLDEFRTDRLAALEAELNTRATTVTCPDCNQEALVIDSEDDADTCLFCLATTDGEELAQRYVSDVLWWSWKDEADGGENPLHECFNCESFALVAGAQVARRPKLTHVCFTCAAVFEAEDLGRCGRCGALKASDDEALCSGCWTDVVSG
ncbi:hypothetical protein [Sinomonas sp. G460-2]|uniref:hypothetical protein n=1 Tax=Sinomonas sp. G460-2 TaxID=3393464 RepID=UPI0039F06CB9